MGEAKIKEIENGQALQQIAAAIKEIEYGYVEVIVQDSKVIQINKTEKIRLDKLAKEGEDKL